jgi:hypothetical protein
MASLPVPSREVFVRNFVRSGEGMVSGRVLDLTGKRTSRVEILVIVVTILFGLCSSQYRVGGASSEQETDVTITGAPLISYVQELRSPISC